MESALEPECRLTWGGLTFQVESAILFYVTGRSSEFLMTFYSNFYTDGTVKTAD